MKTDARSTLHTLNKTAQNTSLNTKLSQIIKEDDAVILIEDGVYQCLTLFTENTSNNDSHWSERSKLIYALKDDALARGIHLSTKSIIFLSYEEFVALCLKHNKVVSWY